MMFGMGRSKEPQASANYLSHYHLSIHPFAEGADGQFLYLDAERQQTLDMLQHLTQYSEEVLLICGELGSGKSTLAQQFMQRSEEHWRCCRVDGQQSVEADSLFAQLARCYEINLQSVPADQLLAGLQTQLSALQEQRLAVLLVDDAHALSADALEIILHLAQLEGENGKLIRLVLFSEPDISIRLSEPRFSALPAAHRIDLKGMAEEDTTAYVLQRLRAAGLSGNMPLDHKELRLIHRNSRGMPGYINQQAHHQLQQRHRHGGSRLNRQGFKLGIAATAIIGTVLGLHGRVGDMLGGSSQAVSVGVPERPVLRLSEEAQSWAVVIRDGESIQISCGVTGDDTVGVRPTFSTAALTRTDTVLTRPLLSTQTSLDGDSEATEALPREPIMPSLQEVGLQQQAEMEAVPEAVVEVQPEQLAQAPREESPPVVTKPVELSLKAVSPTPIEANDTVQEITLHGQGFIAGSKLALSRAGKVDVLADEQARIVDAETLVMEVNTGNQAAAWAVQLSTPDNRRSNVLRFQVEMPQPLPSGQEVAERTEKTAEPEKETAETLASEEAIIAVGEQKIVETAPVVGNTVDVKPKEVAARPLVAPARGAAIVKSVESPKPPSSPPRKSPAVPTTTGLQGTEWLAAQPAENFTVQLLVSGQEENLQQLISRYQPPTSLARFAMQREDKRLYVLTQGSYPNRGAAEQAAQQLPGELQPWIRTLESVQAVMQPITERPAKALETVGDLAGVKDDAWVWSQDPGHYTIQLAAAAREENILEAMQGLSLPGERVVVQTLREGRPWYVLIYGSFANSDAARGTIARLPEPQRRVGPWPRSFASLQDEMGRAGTTR